MVLTKTLQEKLLEEFLQKKPNATAGDVESFIDGVVEGIKIMKNYK